MVAPDVDAELDGGEGSERIVLIGAAAGEVARVTAGDWSRGDEPYLQLGQA